MVEIVGVTTEHVKGLGDGMRGEGWGLGKLGGTWFV